MDECKENLVESLEHYETNKEKSPTRELNEKVSKTEKSIQRVIAAMRRVSSEYISKDENPEQKEGRAYEVRLLREAINEIDRLGEALIGMNIQLANCIRSGKK
jgi:tRNA uridine 5-carbamoylmethylation protein Kti12